MHLGLMYLSFALVGKWKSESETLAVNLVLPSLGLKTGNLSIRRRLAAKGRSLVHELLVSADSERWCFDISRCALVKDNIQ